MELIIGLGLLILVDLLALRFGTDSRDGFHVRDSAPRPESLHFQQLSRERDGDPVSS